MNNLLLCTLLFTTSFLHGLREFETTTQKAVKRHKAQQQKTKKKLEKKLKNERDELQKHANIAFRKIYVPYYDEELDEQSEYLNPQAQRAYNELIFKLQSLPAAKTTKVISEWALLAQRQPRIEPPFKKDAYSYKPFIRKYDYEPYEEEVLLRRLAYLQAQNKITSNPPWFLSTAELIAHLNWQK
ncbi:MAG: hypothetical protein P4L31_02780 [Candidatus Babeliales bacterium]|nr:hypothetical protein [Candidatus Babeliales bacterium]